MRSSRQPTTRRPRPPYEGGAEAFRLAVGRSIPVASRARYRRPLERPGSQFHRSRRRVRPSAGRLSMVEVDHDLAHVSATLQVSQRLGQLCECIAAVDDRTQPVESDGAVHGFEILPAADGHRLHFHVRRAHRDDAGAPGQAADQCDTAEQAGRCHRLFNGIGAADVDGEIRARGSALAPRCSTSGWRDSRWSRRPRGFSGERIVPDWKRCE